MEQQAIKGKTMVKAFFGELVPWPREDEFLDEDVEEATRRIHEKYGRHDQEAVADDEDESDDEEEDGDDSGEEDHVDNSGNNIWEPWEPWEPWGPFMDA